MCRYAIPCLRRVPSQPSPQPACPAEAKRPQLGDPMSPSVPDTSRGAHGGVSSTPYPGSRTNWIPARAHTGGGGVMVDCSLPNLHVVQHTARAMLDSPASRRCVGVDDLLPRQQLTAVNRTAHAANAPRHGTRGALCSNCLACGWQSMNVTWTWHPRDLWLPSLLRIMRRIRRSC